MKNYFHIKLFISIFSVLNPVYFFHATPGLEKTATGALYPFKTNPCVTNSKNRFNHLQYNVHNFVNVHLSL